MRPATHLNSKGRKLSGTSGTDPSNPRFSTFVGSPTSLGGGQNELNYKRDETGSHGHVRARYVTETQIRTLNWESDCFNAVPLGRLGVEGHLRSGNLQRAGRAWKIPRLLSSRGTLTSRLRFRKNGKERLRVRWARWRKQRGH